MKNQKKIFVILDLVKYSLVLKKKAQFLKMDKMTIIKAENFSPLKTGLREWEERDNKKTSHRLK